METEIDEPPSSLLLAEIFTDTALFYTAGGLVLVFLLIASALISGSEVAFFSLSADQLDQCKKKEHPGDEKVIALMEKPRNLLATILILNNFINVTIITLSTFIVWEAAGTKTAGGIVIALLTVTVTVAIVFFGEVMPKVYAAQNNLTLARFMARFLGWAELISRPLSVPLISMSNFIEKRYKAKGYNVSVEELHQALEITTDHEQSSDEEKEILKGIVNFGTLTVKQIMKSRMDVTAADTELNFFELLEKISDSGFSRIPVYTETMDKIDGLLYIKDLLPYLEEAENFDWKPLIRNCLFVPETKKIDALLKDFQDKRMHMAIVVDEYGGTSGLVTLEDIIEEIIGEINDEFDDEEEVHYNKLDKNTYIFEGKISLNDFCKVLDEVPDLFEEIKGESESLGGLILEINGKLPRAGEKINFDKYVFTVVSVDNKRIKRIRVFVKEPLNDKKDA